MTINYSISETKYNTDREKRKMNEKMKAREKLYQVVFSYFMKNSIHMAKGEDRATKDFSLPF